MVAAQWQLRLRTEEPAACKAREMAAVAAATDLPGGCPCLQYPRSLRSVLSEEDRQHLSRLYFDQVHGQSRRRYFNLLRLLGRAKGDDATWKVLDKLHERVAAEFGDGFVIINDFFSYRSANERLFPSWHQDGEFWLADDGSGPFACRNFNLWILLDHRGMNYSFDLVQPDEHNAWMYSALNAHAFGAHAAALNFSAPRAWFKPEEARRLSRGGGAAGQTCGPRECKRLPGDNPGHSSPLGLMGGLSSTTGSLSSCVGAA